MKGAKAKHERIHSVDDIVVDYSSFRDEFRVFENHESHTNITKRGSPAYSFDTDTSYMQNTLVSAVLNCNSSAMYLNLVEARDLKPSSEHTDAYACIQMGQQKVYTTTLYTSMNRPCWNEECCLLLDGRHNFLVIRVWDEDVLGADDCLGELRIPVWEYAPECLHSDWFQLEKPRGDTKLRVKVSGEVHLRFIYRYVEHDDEVRTTSTQDNVSARYDELVQCIVDRSMCVAKFILKYLESTKVLAQRNGEKCLNAILTIFENHTFPATMELLDFAVEQELHVCETSYDLFRKNSIAPKLLSKFASDVGSDYLKSVLKPLVTNIVRSRKNLEIDPNRLKRDKYDLKKNQEHLIKKCELFLGSVIESLDDVPVQLQYAANVVRRVISTKYPNDVSNCLASMYFLRFLCPAIVTPEQHQLVEDPPKSKTYRNLMLIAKTLQTLANKSASNVVAAKEPYMECMMPFFEQNLERVNEFLMSVAEVKHTSVRPAFEHLNEKQLLVDLVRLHTFLYENREDMRKYMNELYGDQLPVVQEESDETVSYVTDTDREKIDAFFIIIERLGPPERKTSKDFVQNLSDQMPEHDTLVNPYLAPQSGERPGWLRRLGNRVFSRFGSFSSSSHGGDRHFLRTVQQDYLEKQKLLTAMVEDRNSLLEERDLALRLVHEVNEELVHCVESQRMYTALLESALQDCGGVFPQKPQTLVEAEKRLNEMGVRTQTQSVEEETPPPQQQQQQVEEEDDHPATAPPVKLVTKELPSYSSPNMWRTSVSSTELNRRESDTVLLPSPILTREPSPSQQVGQTSQYHSGAAKLRAPIAIDVNSWPRMKPRQRSVEVWRPPQNVDYATQCRMRELHNANTTLRAKLELKELQLLQHVYANDDPPLEPKSPSELQVSTNARLTVSSANTDSSLDRP